MIIGVTASGKASTAFQLAKKYNTEIISIDSMKVYKRMDIGTAKASKEKQQQLKYNLIDVVEPSESFSVGSYLDLTDKTIKRLKDQNKPVIAVGGTALYIKTLLFGLFEGPGKDENIRNQLKQRAKIEGSHALHAELTSVDPEAADRIHPNDKKRIIRALEVFQLTGQPISSFQQQFTKPTIRDNWTIIGLTREKETESRRINARVKKMIELGLVDEVKSLLAEPKPLSKQAKAAIGYAEIIEYLNGQIPLDQAIEKIKKNTRHLAKHQRTWFKTFPNVNWINISEDTPLQKIIDRTEQIAKL